MEPPKKISLIIKLSEKYKAIAYTPPFTGSNTLSKIMENFEFKRYKVEEGVVSLFSEELLNTHAYPEFEGSNNYKLIMTVRNPYSRIVKSFQNNYLCQEKFSPNNWKNEFIDYVYNEIYSPSSYSGPFNFKDLNPTFINRKVDYLIRIENIRESYESIPFIKNSEFYEKGLLDQILNRKINAIAPTIEHFRNIIPIDWTEYYFDEEVINLIYNRFELYFKTFNYSKLS